MPNFIGYNPWIRLLVKLDQENVNISDVNDIQFNKYEILSLPTILLSIVVVSIMLSILIYCNKPVLNSEIKTTVEQHVIQ